MGLYIAYSVDVNSRNASAIFSFQNGYYFLFEQGSKISLSLKSSNDLLTTYKKIVRYAFDRHLDSYEIELIGYENTRELLEFLSKYLIDKDITIGLITSDESIIESNKKFLDDCGAAYAKTNVDFSIFFETVSTAPKFKVSSDETFSPTIQYSKRLTKKSKPTHYENHTITLDESFHEKFIKLLIESGRDNVDIYKKAGVTRQVFSKIVSDKSMIPSKLTLISLCIGLELPFRIANELVLSAGYSLSNSIMLDSIAIKFLKDEIYDLDLINSELNEYGCQLLGWHPRNN